MVYGYCRVSTKKQLDGNSLEQQKQEILSKYPQAKIIQEQFSAKTVNRPEFKKLIEELQTGDVLVCCKLDRFARNTEEGLKLMRELLDQGVAVEILNFGGLEGGFNSKNKLMFSIMMAFAEFERDLIIERTQAGKEIAKQDPNFKEGRPKIHKQSKIDHALSLLREKDESGNYRYTVKHVAQIMGMSESTLYRAKSSERSSVA